MKESQDPKRLGEHPEAHRLSGHPEPGSLPAHEEEEKVAAAAPAAPVVEEIPATSDAQETRGVFRGAGWVALAILAIMVAAALIWRPRVHDNAPQMAYANGQTAGYAAMQIDGVTGIDTIVELINTVNIVPASGSVASNAAPASSPAATAQGMTPSAVVVYLFNTDKSDVPETASLTAVARQAAKTGKTVVIKAYTDETGNPAYNRRLSDRRARSVGKYMLAHGVPQNHIKAKGYGPTHAYADNAQDRRAEISLE